MAEARELVQVSMTATQVTLLEALKARRARLGLDARNAATIRDAVALAMTASDEDLKRGEL